MVTEQLVIVLATAIASATPLVFAVLGETLSERAGVINLSAEGTIMFCAMAGFAAALATSSVLVGFSAAAVIGALIAMIVAFSTITLKQSQIAVGFVLALLFSDLSSFLGTPLVRIPGPTVPAFPIPVLSEIPILGRLFFSSDPLVYLSYIAIGAMWVFFYRTRAGLMLRAIGEQPGAAFVRGANVVRLRHLYTLLGGALMGIAGAAFSLDFKAGWSFRHTGGYGWIALAIVIFGGWNPLRAALGAYLFGILQSLASVAQDQFQGVPTQVLNVAPFALMIVLLVVTSSGWLERLLAGAPAPVRRRVLQALHAAPPAALGKPFRQD